MVVCFANYCRSPVAKYLLQQQLKDAVKVSSAGLQPIIDNKMDPRSSDYLISKGVKEVLHIPKKVTSLSIKQTDLVLAVDHFILQQLNKLFPSMKHKFRLLSQNKKGIFIEDPYRYKKNEYIKVMDKINDLCSDFRI